MIQGSLYDIYECLPYKLEEKYFKAKTVEAHKCVLMVFLFWHGCIEK